ncbi:MAG: hypothetical protein OHK0029_31470 [Armatimonadaceae bacterium]
MKETAGDSAEERREFWRQEGIPALLLMLLVCFAYALANPYPRAHFDYTFRIALALLHGETGLSQPISWLNELVPFDGKYYSVFPLGSVLSMVPVAVVQQLRGTAVFPAREVVSLAAGTTALFLWMLSGRYRLSPVRRVLLVLLVLLGSWLWCNSAYGGAWQIALQVAVLGQCGALAFSLIYRQPVLAGFFFAVGFGNRTEILLTAPLYLYLLLRPDPKTSGMTAVSWAVHLRREWRTVAGFCLFPLLLGLGTLWYNFVRFHSFTDFGYARIPGVLEESWYRYGIFSLRYLPQNIQAMLFSSSWQAGSDYPFLRPEPFGGSVLSVCPYLLLLMRRERCDPALCRVAWVAIGILTFILWIHGNAGGWQFSYRYASVLLPWFFVLFLEARGAMPEDARDPAGNFLLAISVLLNAWACYQFYWSGAFRV